MHVLLSSVFSLSLEGFKWDTDTAEFNVLVSHSPCSVKNRLGGAESAFGDNK